MINSEITAIIPVYNDRTSFEKAIPKSIDTLRKITESFEIIIAEDGSNDGSAAEFIRSSR